MTVEIHYSFSLNRSSWFVEACDWSITHRTSVRKTKKQKKFFHGQPGSTDQTQLRQLRFSIVFILWIALQEDVNFTVLGVHCFYLSLQQMYLAKHLSFCTMKLKRAFEITDHWSTFWGGALPPNSNIIIIIQNKLDYNSCFHIYSTASGICQTAMSFGPLFVHFSPESLWIAILRCRFACLRRKLIELACGTLIEIIMQLNSTLLCQKSRYFSRFTFIRLWLITLAAR